MIKGDPLAQISRFVRNVCSSPDEYLIKTKPNIVVIYHFHADINTLILSLQKFA